MVGKEILLALLMEKGFDITKQHMDCGNQSRAPWLPPEGAHYISPAVLTVLPPRSPSPSRLPEILLALLMEKGFDITKQHMDCGIEIFDAKRQKTDAGGSGCGCSAITLTHCAVKGDADCSDTGPMAAILLLSCAILSMAAAVGMILAVRI